jgi:DASS family divalent anion:Na+ symporter
VTRTPDAPKAARESLRSMGPLTRDEWIVAVAFAFTVTGWVMAGTLKLSLAAVAFAGLGALLATGVLTRRASTYREEPWSPLFGWQCYLH